MQPSKRDIAEHILSRGDLFVHFDPRGAHVVLPEYLRNKEHCVLQFGKNLPQPIPDLWTSNEGITGTLTFDFVPFTCFVPWSSVFALVGPDSMGMTWDDDMPPSVREDAEAEKHRAAHLKAREHITQSIPTRVTSRPRQVRGKPRVKLPPYLRVVK